MGCTHDSTLCAELQREELEVLESIYPDNVSRTSSKDTIRLEVPIELSEPTFISVHSQKAVDESTQGVKTSSISMAAPSSTTLSQLPPLILEILLPAHYPYAPPEIVSIQAVHSWLRFDRFDVRNRLLELWQEGEGVLYPWVEWIRNGDVLDALEMTSTVEGKPGISIPHSAPRLLVPVLEAYEASSRAVRFSQTAYECQICMTSIKGARCVMLSCSHVFCRTCLEDFWKLCIREGDVGRVGCPDPVCVKEHREASEEEVRRVVTEQEVIRWKWLRAKLALERDPTLVHCPIVLCQTAVPRPVDVEEGSAWERLRTCPRCDYSFCAACKRTWHGPVTHCKPASARQLVMEYLATEEGSPARRILESRYGKATIRKFIHEYEDERAFNKWMDESTGSPCPHCELRVEKSHGCNHMKCFKCGTHYCYRCGAGLQGKDPYKHFSTPGLPCYQCLFDREDIEDDGWQRVEGFDL